MAAPEPVTSAGERFDRGTRLRRSGDFARCYKTGRRRTGTRVFMLFAPNELGHPRLGITASRKVGGAVVRHRLKRWIRETYRRWPGRSNLAPLDLVVHLHPVAGRSAFAEIQGEVVRLLSSLPRRPEPAR